MKKTDILWTFAIFLTLTIFVASAQAAVRVRVPVAPVSVPAVGMPLYPFPIEVPNFPTLPMQLTSLPNSNELPATILPNGGATIGLPEAIETPKWPTTQVRVVNVNRTELGVQQVRVIETPRVRVNVLSVSQQELPADSFGDLIDEVREAVGIKDGESLPTETAMNRAFDGSGGNGGSITVAVAEPGDPVDGTQAAHDEDDGYVEPRMPRPIIDRSERMTLPEDELRQDLGI
jgi:hypothetical protein